MSSRIVRTTSRRSFLKGALAAGIFPQIVKARVFGANEKVHIALLGCGGRSGVTSANIAKHAAVRIVAACDPRRDKRGKFAAQFDEQFGRGTCRPVEDFREVMADKEIDGVMISTPDHWHVPLAIAAARAGKDMYVEKPLSVAMSWSQRLRREMAGKDLIFQYGTQQRSMRQFRQAVELVRNGYIGEITHVDAWCEHMDSQAESVGFGSTVEIPVPEGLNYDIHHGPSPSAKPYTKDRCTNYGSYHIYDYALGFIAGWGAHPLDTAQWGLGTDDTSPVRYEGTGTLAPAGKLFDTTRYWDIHCEYANGVKMRFMDEKVAKPLVEKYHSRFIPHGTTWHGTEGWISVDRGAMFSHDKNKLRKVEIKPDESPVYKSENHYHNFVDCMISRKPTVNPLEAAIRSDTISHLADIVVRSGKPVQWDPKTEKIVDGTPAQTALLDRVPRKEWDFFM